MTRAQVSLETREAIATYDPRATNVDALLAAVNAVEEPFPFVATVKVPLPPLPQGDESVANQLMSTWSVGCADSCWGRCTITNRWLSGMMS